MELNSLTMILQSIAKSIAGPALVILGYGVLGAVTGYTVSFLAAGIIGMTALYFILFKPLKGPRMSKGGFLRTLKPMLKYGVPLSIASLISGILAQVYGFMMAIYVSDTMIGNYQAAVNFSVLLTFFTIPIGTVIFPAFAKLDPQNEHELLRAVFASSVKYTAILLVPATMAIMVLSGPMVSTLFGERYAFAPFFLTLYVVSNLFVILGGNIVGNFLAGIGETRLLMKQSILTLSIGLALGFGLIPTLGITGMIIGLLGAGLPSMSWALQWTWKHHKARADFKSSARIFAASGFAAITTYITLNFISLAEWIRLTIGLVIFLGVYIFAAPMIGAITSSEIDNLRKMLSGLGSVSRVINLLLILVEATASLSARTRKRLQSK
jgi:O-antigen/teichoic acid export membrane protein